MGHMLMAYHLDKGTLVMTHFCGAGNQPRMRIKSVDAGRRITSKCTTLQISQVLGPTTRSKLMSCSMTIIAWILCMAARKEAVQGRNCSNSNARDNEWPGRIQGGVVRCRLDSLADRYLAA